MKKLVSALASLVLGASLLTVPAFAASGDVQTYGTLCTECNRGEVILVDSYDTDTAIIGNFVCEKNPRKVDIMIEWYHSATWKCTYCGTGYTQVTHHVDTICNH